MNNSKIDSLADQIISKHEAQEDARSHDVYARRQQTIELIVKTAVLAIVFGPVIFAFGMLFFI